MISQFYRYRNHPVFRPAMLSAGLHVLFLILSMFVPVYMMDLKRDKDIRIHFGSPEGTSMTERRKGEATKRLKARELQVVKEAGRSSSGPVSDIPVKEILKKAAEPKREEAVRTLPIERPAPDIESIVSSTEEKRLRENVPGPRKPVAGGAAAKRLQASQGLADAGKILQSLALPLGQIGLRPAAGSLDVDPEEGMPGFTPARGQGGESEIESMLGEPYGEVSKFAALDTFLDIDLYTYQDPSDGQNYFMIKILAKKDPSAFHVMSKEIIFTIDCSLSISPDRLDEFKKGIRLCLQRLNKGDVFNVVAFRDKAFFFSKESVPATPQTIAAAERFIAGLTSTQRTDVYSAIRTIVSFPLARHPSSVMLISDGRPTHGVVDARELLGAITRINAKSRPIFAFSGGAKVNRYLLDFISYQNRAWSQFIKRTPDIDKGLAEFYAKIKDPIFINLRYRLNNLPEAEVYPKALPDFYQGAEFTLYGVYQNEDVFSMQLLGDVEGETKELVFTRSLKEAKSGGEDIKRGYAYNKVYDLISRGSAEGGPEWKAQIRELSQRYDIKTPYSPDIEKLD